MNKYFNLNIKQREKLNSQSYSLASRCLDPKSDGFLFSFDGRPRIPIFYGRISAETIRNPNKNKLTGRKKGEAKAFVGVADNENEWSSVKISIIDDGYVWIVSPSGKIEEFNKMKIPAIPSRDTMKCMQVKILAKKRQQDVPFILASQRVNRYFSSGTFTELSKDKFWANKLAIELICKQPSRLSVKEISRNITSPVELLSSSELETLVARILEEHGFFVASRVPGGLQNIDIIAWNDNSRNVNLHGLKVESGCSVSIQIKQGDIDFKKYDNVEIDYFIATGNEKRYRTQNLLGLDWFDFILESSPKSAAWLKRSTRWAEGFL